MGRHKQRSIAVKFAEIDEGIVPVVLWLNSFEGVFTRYCCEGLSDCSADPYVIFFCDEFDSVRPILKKFGNRYGHIEVEEFSGIVRYWLKFNGKRTMRKFIKEVLQMQGGLSDGCDA